MDKQNLAARLRRVIKRYGLFGLFAAGLVVLSIEVGSLIRRRLLVVLALGCLALALVARSRVHGPICVHPVSPRPPAPVIASPKPQIIPATPRIRPRTVSKPLLDVSTRISSTTGWELPNGTDAQSYMTYSWISNHELLYFTDTETIGELLCKLDTRSGLETTYERVSKLWSGDGLFKKQIEISPDGKWVLWDGDYSNHTYHRIYGARLNGSQRFHIPGKSWPSWRSVHWMPDCRRFVEFDGEYDEQTLDYSERRILIRDVKSPHTAAALSDSERGGVDGLRKKGIYWPSATLAVEQDPPDEWPCHGYRVVQAHLGPGGKYREWRFNLPAGAEGHEIAASQSGNRLAGVSSSTILGEAQPKFEVVSLWTADLHGGHRRVIGTLEVSNADDEEYILPELEKYPHELKWLPDGKHVSFIYKSALYTAPVP